MTAAARDAYETWRARMTQRLHLENGPQPWAKLSLDEQGDWTAGIGAGIEQAAAHPACDRHRWYAVVSHFGSFAYGFAATQDGLAVYDDVSEFEDAKARDFE